MAVNESRSMNENLRHGITDGVVKKVMPNWGGDDTDAYAAAERNSILPPWYNAVDAYGQRRAHETAADRLTKLSEKPLEDAWDSPITVEPPKPLVP